MDPQRWAEIERLYHLAREQGAGEREKFLAEACCSDEALRREVESLLARPSESQDFLEAPALEVAAMALAKDRTNPPPIDLTGHTIARYRVLGKIGEGGMGVVYKARDMNLRRFVALKVLPPEHVADPDRKRRFVQEARAASALNHPNIVTIHDITREGDTDFIVMEYVEGKTLDQRIGRRGLRLNDALKCAVQIADALAKAHSAGIVHRDLKPTNIMVNADGVVKVLDFGLAKLTERIPGDEFASSATLEAEGKSLTEEGIIIGTVSYMSPEQAEGKKVDARSDIFSFGSVLYEMVTGQRAFQGTSKMSTLSSILNQEPKPVSTIAQAIPAELERLINRCLRKDPARRFQHMDDVKVALDELNEDVGSGRAAATVGTAKIASPSAAKGQTRKRRWILAFAALLAICLLGVGILWFVKRGVVPLPELTQRRLTVNSSENPVFSGIISPDGKYVAYSDATGIHLKLIETNEERILARPSGIASGAVWDLVAWFPDGTRLLANLSEAGGRSSTWIVSIIAENATRLRDDAIGWSVSPDGARIAYTTGWSVSTNLAAHITHMDGSNVWSDMTNIAYWTGSKQNYYQEIWTMNPQGDGAEKILRVEENSLVYAVHWSSDSLRLAYIRNRLTPTRLESSIETCTLNGTARAVVVADPLLTSYGWMPQGYMLYARTEVPVAPTGNGNLWKIQISLGTGKAEGTPTRLTSWAGFNVDRLGISANGKRVTYRRGTFQTQIYLGELEAGGSTLQSARRLTLDEAGNIFSGWTADSRDVLFRSDRSGITGMYTQAIDGGAARLVVSPPSGMDIEGGIPSPDGSWLLYGVTPPEAGTSTPYRVMRVPIHGGPSRLVLEGKNMRNPWFHCTEAPATFCAIGESSPDGKLLTITSFDPLKGRGRILKAIKTDPTDLYDWALFPDGTKLAFIKRGERETHIRLFSLNGGKDQDISVKAWGSLQNLEYSDGKAFYCGSGSPEGSTLLRIDMEGRAQVLWRQRGPYSIWGRPSPDGRHLAFSQQLQNSNLWMVEGF